MRDADAASACRSGVMTSGSVNGADPRTTAATLNHRIVHTANNTREPVSQMAARATGQSGVASAAVGVAGAPDVIASGVMNGWLTVLSAADNVGSGIVVDDGHPMARPTAISDAKGTRNFSEAAVQMPKRARAPFLRSSHARPHATPRTIVDCHR